MSPGLRRILSWVGPCLLLAVASGLALLTTSDPATRQWAIGTGKAHDPKVVRTMRRFASDPVDTIPGAGRTGLRVDIMMSAADKKSYESVYHGEAPVMRRWNEVRLALGDGMLLPAKLRGRGRGSATVRNKSFLVDLLVPRRITASITLQKLMLLNHAFDPHGFEMSYCFGLLRRLGLFPVYFRHVRLFVNGESHGLYLLVERPRDALRRMDRRVVSVLRSDWSGGWETRWARSDVKANEIIDRLQAVLRMTDTREQARELKRIVDLEAVMRWCAFNSVVQIADTIDELFAYELRSDPRRIGRLGVMAWDYDDLQLPPSHPRITRTDPLTWAAEHPLEKAVIDNPELYESFRTVLDDLLTGELTPLRLETELHELEERLAQMDPEGREKRRHAMERFERNVMLRHATLLRRVRRGSR